MALTGIIKEGATTIAASGGTDVTVSTLGIQGGTNTLIFSTDAVNTTRRLLTAKVSLSAANANSPGGRTLQRNTLKFVFPKVCADGTTSMDFFEVNTGTHPESTSAEVETRMEQVAQYLIASKSLPFFYSGDLS
jgi:hypothetical protein